MKYLPMVAVIIILGLFAWTGVEAASAYPYPMSAGVAQQYCHTKTDPPAIANGANHFGGYTDTYTYSAGDYVVRQYYYNPWIGDGGLGWFYNCRVIGTQDYYNNVVGVSYLMVWAAPNWATPMVTIGQNVTCYYNLLINGGCAF